MRKVVYKVAGIETTSYAEMKEWERKYHLKAETELRDIKEEVGKTTPIREAMLKQFGVVRKDLRDKVQLD